MLLQESDLRQNEVIKAAKNELQRYFEDCELKVDSMLAETPDAEQELKK